MYVYLCISKVDIYFLFEEEKMAQSFIGLVQDSLRTGLGIPVKTKILLPRTILLLAGPPFGFKS